MCGQVMAVFDGHLKYAHCRDKGVDDNPCVLKKECAICKVFTPEQAQQLATPPTDPKNGAQRFVRLQAMILAKSFAVPVKTVMNPL